METTANSIQTTAIQKGGADQPCKNKSLSDKIKTIQENRIRKSMGIPSEEK